MCSCHRHTSRVLLEMRGIGLLAIAVIIASVSNAQTVTVTTLEDTSDTDSRKKLRAVRRSSGSASARGLG